MAQIRTLGVVGFGMLMLMGAASPVQATGTSGPPMAFQAWVADNGIAFSWEPPITGLVIPVIGYTVYAALPIPVPIASAGPNDRGIQVNAEDSGVYFVVAVVGGGESPPSNPAVPLPVQLQVPPWHCPPLTWWINGPSDIGAEPHADCIL